MKGGIYIIESPSGDCYVGSTVNFKSRKAVHFHALRSGTHHNALLQDAFLLYGEAGLAFKPIIICAKANLLLYEQRAIDALRSSYNTCRIAGSNKGRKATPETLKRLSEAKRNPSAETRAKISAAGRGRVASAETRAKRSASLKGRVFTDEHRARISAAAKWRPGNRKGIIVSDETRAKLSAAATGRKYGPQSAETKAKASAALKAAWERRKAAKAD